MVEGTDTGWLAVLEKKGLHQAAGILENYGIDSETNVSLLDQGDLRNLVSQGLRPMQLKKLEHSMISPWNHSSMVHQLQLL